MATRADLDEPTPAQPRRRIGCWVSLALLVLVALGLAVVWSSRRQLADNIISDELAKRGIQATYEVVSIGGQLQVLRNIVVGDPDSPDLTVERAELILGYGFGLPHVAGIKLVRPRLFGTYIGGKLSFGALDPLIFEGEERPLELPDLDLSLVDGRALVEGDFGPVGIKLEGKGNLRGGFTGELGAIAPRLAVRGCEPARTTIYGRIAVDGGRPKFEGPLRLGRLACEGAFNVSAAAFQIDARADGTLTIFEGNVGSSVNETDFGSGRLGKLTGTTRFTWRDGGLTARYDLTGTQLATPQAVVARLELDGSLRARRTFDRVEVDTQLDGTGVSLGSELDSALAGAVRSTEDTLLGPILEQVRGRLASEQSDSRLVADLVVRHTDGRTSVVVPSARLHGNSGATLLSLSRVQIASGGSGAPLLSGNFSTGGERLPRIAGRMERRGGGPLQLHLSMAEFAAGPSRLEIPEMRLSQGGDGALSFAGTMKASGALPGGHAKDLVIPVSGNWSSPAGLAMWNECTELRFEALQIANLALDRHRLTLCPARGAPILRYDRGGVRVAAGAPSLKLSGHLGETPIMLRSGAIGIAYPGSISARQLLVSLGPPETASTFAIADLTAQAGDEIAGKFTGADIRLGAVPLDLLDADGNWRYADRRLSLGDARFLLVDRIDPARFRPLSAEGATLSLADNLITAHAHMREPKSGREVTTADIKHDLASGRGHAVLAVDGLTFDSAFQPTDLTQNAEGVVALVRGTVTGTGHIDWDGNGITSSGRFSSDSLDFAAAFGPVKGASGTVVFSDLLGLTTAPSQSLRVASINPGIEINDGEIRFQLVGGEVLALEGGSWPFMGGTLRMQPVQIHVGAPEARRYVLEIEALDAARFVEHMELNNMAATGTFDGVVPLVFDTTGNGRIEGGLLTSRPPGGNVSYVGELTYEDLGAVANVAFDALRSLDYRSMTVDMNGSLTGEIVTHVKLDGVSQGQSAKRNLLTKAIEGLPIKVDVNIRAPFYQLIGATKALYDPAAIRDPREVGLIDAQGHPIEQVPDSVPTQPAPPQDRIPDEAVIQRRESEELP